jgi:hypothetical protein
MNTRELPSRAHRAAGALLGVHAGDALGATLEFHSWARIKELYPDGLRDIVGGGPFGWPAGHATDDTSTTRQQGDPSKSMSPSSISGSIRSQGLRDRGDLSDPFDEGSDLGVLGSDLVGVLVARTAQNR